MSVDTFTEALRLIVYAVGGLFALALIVAGVELAAAELRRRRRRPWWRSEPYDKQSNRKETWQ